MLKVIGLGSPFGDDQVGLLLIEQLRQNKQLQPFLKNKLELIALDRPGANLLAQFEGIEKAVVIDAVVTGAHVGELHHWQDVSDLENCCSSLSSHGLGLAQTLALGRQLHMLPAQLEVIGIEIDPAERSSELSPDIQQKVFLLTESIVGLIMMLLKLG